MPTTDNPQQIKYPLAAPRAAKSALDEGHKKDVMIPPATYRAANLHPSAVLPDVRSGRSVHFLDRHARFGRARIRRGISKGSK
jgi:hypothetical protein